MRGARRPCAGTASGARPRAPTGRPRRRLPATLPLRSLRASVAGRGRSPRSPRRASARAITFTPRSCPSSPGFATITRYGTVLHGSSLGLRLALRSYALSQRSVRRAGCAATCPVAGVRGQLPPTTSRRRGRLKAASLPSQCARSVSRSSTAVEPWRSTTTAQTTSPHSASGTPTTATSAIDGWSASAASTSPGATVSPPVRSTSRARPTIDR